MKKTWQRLIPITIPCSACFRQKVLPILAKSLSPSMMERACFMFILCRNTNKIFLARCTKMRALITSIISLALLIGCWGIFYHYSDENLNGIITECEDVVMAAIQNENWDEAYDTFKEQYKIWHEYQNKALYFLDTQPINTADEEFAKTLMYIKAKDVSNSSGELLALTEQLRVLHENEGLHLRNIL
ncbi:DUF4363 family protein [Anaerotruncus sp. 80]|uniref:DUF4363 family protein n=2 Tax=Bacillota TaxID=1239 RepID=A0A845QP16_9FIRM|nr:DUF4363 family protein [Anaerotruncus colihominis]NCE97763.1 DUF4363 family protein [Emergencia sp. 1XD21-10]NCF03455.1 DUF4363 family protein [Anaerotruncus sp. 80]